MSEWAEFEIARELAKIRRTLENSFGRLQSIKVGIMPKTVAVGETAVATIIGFDQFGKPFAIPSTDAVTLSAAVPGDVNFSSPVFNADGSVSVTVTGVNADPGDYITAVVAGVTSSADVLTVTAPVPVLTTATLTLN